MAGHRISKMLLLFFLILSFILVNPVVSSFCSSVYSQNQPSRFPYDTLTHSKADMDLAVHSNSYCPEIEDIRTTLLQEQNSQSRRQEAASRFSLKAPENRLPCSMVSLTSDEIFVHFGSAQIVCFLHNKDGMI